jgi:hypothetical protein
MKIDELKFPSLFKDSGFLKTSDIFTKHIITQSKNDIRYVAKTFSDAAMSNVNKLLPLRDSLSSSCKTILTGRGNLHIAMHYKLTNSEDTITAEGAIFIPEGMVCCFAVMIKKNEATSANFPVYTIPNRSNIGDHINIWLPFIIALELFLQHADLEVRNLAPSRQIWDGPTCLYNNKTKYPVNVIDCTWFTTLVKSDAFKVRGHFRLQPHGEGMAKRKLVWISEFQKEGYTRQAKKLSEVDVEEIRDTN